jgi:hypothetical protein
MLSLFSWRVVMGCPDLTDLLIIGKSFLRKSFPGIVPAEASASRLTWFPLSDGAGPWSERGAQAGERSQPDLATVRPHRHAVTTKIFHVSRVIWSVRALILAVSSQICYVSTDIWTVSSLRYAVSTHMAAVPPDILPVKSHSCNVISRILTVSSRIFNVRSSIFAVSTHSCEVSSDIVLAARIFAKSERLRARSLQSGAMFIELQKPVVHPVICGNLCNLWIYTPKFARVLCGTADFADCRR